MGGCDGRIGPPPRHFGHRGKSSPRLGASEPEALWRFAGTLPGTIVIIGLEAGPVSQWLHRGLAEAELDVVLMETRQVKGALKAMPIQTDWRGAEGIARLLHIGWFRPVHCKCVSAQEVCALRGARKAIQQRMIAFDMSLRGLLQNFGLKVGAISRGRYDLRVRELVTGNAMLEAATKPMLKSRDSLRQELSSLERELSGFAKDDPVCRLLMTLRRVRLATVLEIWLTKLSVLFQV